MVNENIYIKEKILECLYSAKGQIVSGRSLSENFNISRTAIWKHINVLKENGFEIESGSKGYVLLNHNDLLMPFCFSGRFRNRIFYFRELESTMDQAKKLVKKEAPHLSAVIAEYQTLGRGRLARQWFSQKGGLWFTIILRPEIPPPFAYIYNFAASLCFAGTLKEMFDLKVSVKWPNDLLIGEKKLAGFLSEMATRGDMVEYINIGIGININNEPEKMEPRAISLKNVLGKQVARKAVLETFLENFETLIHRELDPFLKRSGTSRPQDACRRVIDKWKKQTATIGSRVRVETLNDVYEGLAVDVDETGALIIKDSRGDMRTIIYGDCFHT